MGEIPRGFRSTINLQKLYRRPSLIALKQLLCISRNLDLIAHHPGFPASSLTSPCCSAERTRFKTRSPFDSSQYCFARSLTNAYRLQQSPSSGSYISHSLLYRGLDSSGRPSDVVLLAVVFRTVPQESHWLAECGMATNSRGHAIGSTL